MSRMLCILKRHFKKRERERDMQTQCLRGRHSQGGDWSAKWNMFAFQIHTVKQDSLHLFKTLLMSFNTTSWLPLLPPRVCVCVCLWWWTTPLAILSSIVPHFLWTSKGMRGWPFENYGGFQKVITGDEHLKWRATKIQMARGGEKKKKKNNWTVEKTNFNSYRSFVKGRVVLRNNKRKFKKIVSLPFTVKPCCPWGLGGNMSTNVATVRVDANYQLHKWKQSDSKFTLPLQDKMDVRKAENIQNLCFC